MSNKKTSYDTHIIDALKSLQNPMKTFDGHDVIFEVDKRHETIFQHIANKKHHLHVVDINVIPNILKSSTSLRTDRSGSKFRNYIGKRGKKNEKLKYLKIVTQIVSNNKETVITLFPVKTDQKPKHN